MYAFVLLDEPALPSARDLGRALKKGWWDPRTALPDLVVEDDTLSFDMDGGRASLHLDPHPYPAPKLEAHATAQALWPGAFETLRRHRAGILCTILYDEPPPPLARALSLTRLLAAVLGAVPGLGVLWNDFQANAPSVFRRIAETASPSAPPVPLWINVHAVRAEDGSPVLCSVGLSAFDLMEMEAVIGEVAPSEPFFLLMDIATYLLASGPVLRHGDTMGPPEGGERLRVTHEPSLLDLGETVYRIRQDPPREGE